MATVLYQVKQGDTLASIARRYGFRNWQTIYRHPDNAELRAKRPDPNILYPGDQVVIPDKVSREETCQTECRHKFQRKGEKLWLRLIIRDLNNKPLKNMDYILRVEHLTCRGQTDGKGFLEHEIPETAETGLLYIAGLTFPLKIGHLDPADEVTGWQARLHNLGYYPGPVDGMAADEEGNPSDILRVAIEEFQLDHHLEVDGKMGPKTQNKLVEIHGC